MRLHRLRVEAFGPFAQTQEIDLDLLAGHGLYLIHGPTGAGKSMLLDAICFALFGDVAGRRKGHVASVHSAHAPDVAPRVELELTLDGTRWRIERTGAWERPRRRGTGTTRAAATVRLLRREDGRWVPHATRVEEVAREIDTRLGLQLSQFAQVVLLPQGEFAAFLSARPDERDRLLRRLFDIERYVDLEAWLEEHRAGSRRALEQVQQELAVQRTLLESVLGDLPAGPDDPAAGEVPDDELASWTARLRDRLAGEVAELQVLADRGEHLAGAAQDALAAARRTQEHRQRGERARDDLTRRAAGREQVAAAERALRQDARAAAVAPALDDHDRADAALERARTGLDTARAELDRRRPGLEAQPREQAAAVTAAGPLVERVAAALASWESALSHHATARVEAERAAAVAREHAAALLEQEQTRGAVEQERAGLAGADRWAHRAAAHEEAVVRAAERQDEARRAEGVLRDADARLAAAAQEHDTARARASELAEQRRDHLVASLAADLVPGHPCPVCGSARHPAPAHDPEHDEPVTEADLQDAREAEDTARRTLAAAADDRSAAAAVLGRARDELAGALADAGLGRGGPPGPEPVDLLEAAVALARFRSTTAAAAQAALAGLDTRAADLERALPGLRERDRAATRAAAVAAAGAQRAEEEARTAERGLHDLLGRHARECPCATDPAPDVATDAGTGTGRGVAARVAAVLEQHRRVSAAVDGWHQALDAHRLARQHRDEQDERLTALLTEHGLTDAQQARAARLDPAKRQELADLVEDDRTGRALARAVLAEPQVAAALAAPAPDLAAAQESAAAARDAARAARDDARTRAGVQRRLAQVAAALDDVLARARPLRAEHETVDEIARVVAGSGSNLRRMRLSAYVLAARLEEIVRLANERLATLSQGRLSLAHEDDRARGNARSGLGLVVEDAWTGRRRDPATLSGGETFLASLALALGLGDAVAQENGGARLQTLFVDEGFGSLDEEALEQALEVLDGLRVGGRAVGIVSHVGDLRQRIPAQVRVHRSETGSTVSVHVAGVGA